MKKLFILIIPIILLTGCQEENSQEQNIQNCIDRNGNPKITYCNVNSPNIICKVECFIEAGE